MGYKKQQTKKEMNKPNQTNTYVDTENKVVVTRREGMEGRVKWIQGINCMVMEGNSSFGHEHAIVYTEIEI